MIGLIAGFFPWRLVIFFGIGIGILLAAGWVSSRLQLIGELRVELATAIVTANANAQLAKQAQVENERIKIILAQADETKTAIKTAARKRQINIALAPVSNQPPLSDAGRDWITGLPEPTSSLGAFGTDPSAKRP